MTVTVLGTGLMGTGMSRSLARAGLDVTAWNRTPEKARPLVDAGVSVADTPGAAVSEADVVLTMLFDADSVAQVMESALTDMRRDAIWVQCATVGIDGTRRLADLADKHDIAFVDAPVLGTKQPAELGALTVLASGPARLRDPLAPVFDAIGNRTIWVGDRPGDGHRLKLVTNAWVLSVTAATAQSIALADDLDLDPAQFLDLIAGGPLDCGYAQLKGKAMLAKEFPPAFPVNGAVKDSALIAHTMADAGTSDEIMQALHRRFAAAADAGHADEDMAAVLHAMHVRATDRG